MGWIVISRDAGANANVRIAAGQAEWDEADTDAPSLNIDGAAAAARSPEQSLNLARRLSQGRILSIGVGERTVEVSLAGAAAALLWMDERQDRIGTATGIMRPGDGDERVIRPPVRPPTITAVRGPAQTGLPQSGVTLPPPLARLPEVQSCLEELWTGAEPMHSAARVADGVYLWGVECFRGAYNIGQRFWITGENGADPRPASLPSASGEPTNELVNGGYDPATGTLGGFFRGRGLGDCGMVQEWAWTGQAFELTREVSMPMCAGMPMTHWPAIYRTGD